MEIRMRQTLLFVTLAFLSLFLCTPSAQEPAQKTIQVGVDMVSLPVTVMKRNGQRVADLAKEDFRVYEDKIEQDIKAFSAADEPFSVALLLDTSGSTTEKLQRIQSEAIRFVNQLSPQDSVAVVSFAQEVRLLEDFTTDRARTTAAIRRTASGGFTVLYEAVWLAFKEVLPSAHQRTALVIFSDGVDTASEKATKVETRELAKESRAPVYCIYFNTREEMQRAPGIPASGQTFPPLIGQRTTTIPAPGTGRSTEDYMGGRQYLSDLTDYSGGRVFDALKMEDLSPAFDAIVQELSSQYTIGYYPTNARHDGKYRRVDVKVSKPGLYVQTRQGYYAADDSKKKGKK